MQYDRVSFSTATTGTGTITAGAATSGFRTMASASIPDGTTVQYAIEDGTAWETGSGVTGSTATTLTRVLSVSSTGSLLSLSGAAKCFLTPIAAHYNGLAASAPSIQAVTSAATVTPTFSDDQVNITAQAAALALANPTGTAVDGWGMAIRIKDNATARAITYGTQYRALGVTLPTTTVISKTLYLGLVFNNADTKWDVVAVAQEA